MTLYEEIYQKTPELSKFYRFEGFNSFSYFSFQSEEVLTQILNYIYFSKTERHHLYYVVKRLKQLIFTEILKDKGYNLNKKTLLDISSFKEVERLIENYKFEEQMLSIEFSVLPIINQILSKNTISNQVKETNDRRIERVDRTRCGGGYGFCEEWLIVFELLTFFYSYQRITTENILDFLYIIRSNLIGNKQFMSPASFLLDSKNRSVKINTKIYDDFSKYELMDALQKIVENKLYFPNSIFAKDANDKIKHIIQEYNFQREKVLTLSETIYRRG